MTELQQTEQGYKMDIDLISIEEGFNPREDPTPSEQLVNSIRVHGIQNPIHVRKDPENPEHWLVVDGHRRYLAAKEVDLSIIPVVPQGEIDLTDALLLSLVTNTEQNTLSNKELATAYKRLTTVGGIDDKELARCMGVSMRTLQETMRAIEKAVPKIKDSVGKGDEGIPVRVAARASDLPEEEQENIADNLKGAGVRKGLEVVREAETRVGRKGVRGRKAGKSLQLAADAKERLTVLYTSVMQRLMSDAKDVVSLAHLEVILALRGMVEVTDIYASQGKAPVLVAKPRFVNRLLKEFEGASHTGEEMKKVAKKVAKKGKKAVKKVEPKAEVKAPRKKRISKKSAAA